MRMDPPVAPALPSRPVAVPRSGYLLKARGGLKDGFPDLSKWKKRWFTLKDGTLTWLKNEGASKPLGTLTLDKLTVVGDVPAKTPAAALPKTMSSLSFFKQAKPRFEFLISPTRCAFPIAIAALSEPDRGEWVDALRAECTAEPAPVATPSPPPLPGKPSLPRRPPTQLEAAKSCAREARRRSTMLQQAKATNPGLFRAASSAGVEGRRRSVMRAHRLELASPLSPLSSLINALGKPSLAAIGGAASASAATASASRATPSTSIGEDPRRNDTVGCAIVAALASDEGVHDFGRSRASAASLLESRIGIASAPDAIDDDAACLATTTVEAAAKAAGVAGEPTAPPKPSSAADAEARAAAAPATMSYRCTSYAPKVFESLRRDVWNIEEAEFVATLRRGISGGGVGDGKSGMLFFFSHDRSLVIKTLKKSELRPMLELLPDYTAHMRQHRNSLLCRYLALFCLTVFDTPTPPSVETASTHAAGVSDRGFMSEAMRVMAAVGAGLETRDDIAASVGAEVSSDLVLFTVTFFANPAHIELAPPTISAWRQEYIIIVMSSAFLVPPDSNITPHLMYDLKGSTRNRLVGFEELAAKGREKSKKRPQSEALKMTATKKKAEEAKRKAAAAAAAAAAGEEEEEEEDDEDLMLLRAGVKTEGADDVLLEDVRNGAERITLKDLNLIFGVPATAGLQAPIALQPGAAAALHSQIECDLALLSAHGLMDYSLLLGVHFIDPTESDAEAAPRLAARALFDASGGGAARERVCGQRASCFMADVGGLRARTPTLSAVHSAAEAELLPPAACRIPGEERRGLRRKLKPKKPPANADTLSGAIFYISIIDLLQRYDVSKTLETTVKRKKSRKRGLLVSSVPPVEYAERFRAFMLEVIPRCARAPTPIAPPAHARTRKEPARAATMRGATPGASASATDLLSSLSDLRMTTASDAASKPSRRRQQRGITIGISDALAVRDRRKERKHLEKKGWVWVGREHGSWGDGEALRTYFDAK